MDMDIVYTYGQYIHNIYAYGPHSTKVLSKALSKWRYSYSAWGVIILDLDTAYQGVPLITAYQGLSLFSRDWIETHSMETLMRQTCAKTFVSIRPDKIERHRCIRYLRSSRPIDAPRTPKRQKKTCFQRETYGVRVLVFMATNDNKNPPRKDNMIYNPSYHEIIETLGTYWGKRYCRLSMGLHCFECG